MGGSVLDVGCGDGRSSLALVPPANELVGVDPSGALLDRFIAAATDAGVARRTVHGGWPEVAPFTPIADVVVCHHVVYGVADIVPFVLALTDHARLAVVVELSALHPFTPWREGWRHFWGADLPAGPTAVDFVAVVRELGFDPEHVSQQLTPPPGDSPVANARRRLCLPPERERELADWLEAHPPRGAKGVVTVRWPGAAEH